MKCLLTAVLIAIAVPVEAQYKETVYPKVLYSPNDTFSVSYSSDLEKQFYKPIGLKDTIASGGDGARGRYVVLRYGKESVKLEYNNFPYGQVYYIPFESPRGKTVYRLHFNSVNVAFSKEYVKSNTGKVDVEIPEVYELANVIWMLSPSGQRNLDIDTTRDYYKKMVSWFKPFMNHPIFKKLDVPDSTYYDDYYGFRENSFAFNFDKDIKSTRLNFDGPYYYVWGGDDLFTELKPMVEDFAKKSGYREFYKSNKEYYTQLEKRQSELLPVKKMWDWLEVQFPETKFQSYKVVFSPLITGSHSTQQYHDKVDGIEFREAVMFVCGPESYDRAKISEEKKIGLMSGIVFTEIDHNYVNAVSYQYRKDIDPIFANRELWAKEVDGYHSPQAVFNEYMTHALFCLYIMDTYDKETADYVIANRVSLMVDRRKFSKFKEFNEALIDIRNRNKDKKVVELYTELIEWCKGR